MPIHPLIRACAVALFLMGCAGNGAEELFETAQFEEKQNNLAHARELYEQIVARYPDSDIARKAGERLARVKSQ
jgi:TolA-binding protein